VEICGTLASDTRDRCAAILRELPLPCKPYHAESHLEVRLSFLTSLRLNVAVSREPQLGPCYNFSSFGRTLLSG
jgi:hypothetical protein